jgi:hypothetical protein
MSGPEPAGARPVRPRPEPTGESRSRLRARREVSQRLLPPRLILLTLAGCLLFGYPFLAVFSQALRVAGIPLLYVYLFVAWALFIVVLARLVDPGGRRR